MRAALIVPAGPVAPDAWAAGVEAVRTFLPTLELDVPAHLGAADAALAFLAGSDASRARELLGTTQGHSDLVWMVRGGYGCVRTLAAAARALDELGGSRPLWVFSDGTALAAAWVKRAWPCWSAPPVVQVPRLDEASRRALVRAMAGDKAGVLGLQPVRRGVAEGRLFVGNLTVLASLVGTPWQAPSRGWIWIIEDVAEPAYRIDRLLQQLHQAGALEGLVGLAWGDFTNISEQERSGIETVLHAFVNQIGIVSACGAPVGHGTSNWALPLGVPAVLEVGDERARLTWGAHGDEDATPSS